MADWIRRSWLSTLVTYFTALVRMMRKTRKVLMTSAAPSLPLQTKRLDSRGERGRLHAEEDGGTGGAENFAGTETMPTGEAEGFELFAAQGRHINPAHSDLQTIMDYLDADDHISYAGAA